MSKQLGVEMTAAAPADIEQLDQSLRLNPPDSLRREIVVCANLQAVGAAFCRLSSEELLALGPRERASVRRALTGALVVLRLLEGVTAARE